eukprot:CAMPEP_0174721338 /NCGR_PEP_ID=MMETSP1094-20130205/35959_1 /TAXON_ID=156173 /ORGANISM="Chrysochromulina brevifilum, Strain UTEX LB 985" /LENGTH=189 /DNA_ID=CAMNT_0015922003 /DNA_START=292 /DNA_END=861 /DNA_ORIENTATION=-
MSRSRSPEQRRGGAGSGKGGGRGKGARNEDAKLYVGNLSNDFDENTLRKEFEKFGELSDVFMPKDPNSGERRGFGFVTFVDTRDAEDAIKEMDGKSVDGRSLRVNKPREGPRRDGGGSGGERRGGDRGGSDRGGGDRRGSERGERGGSGSSGVAERGSHGWSSAIPSYLNKEVYDRVTGDRIKKFDPKA